MLPGEDQLKRDARRLKNDSDGLSLSQCYEVIARTEGFKTYASMREAWKSGVYCYRHKK